MAQTLQTWMNDLFDGIYTPLLSDDIESGENWEKALSNMLNANFGVLCFTPGFQKSWLCYEAGVLSETTRYDTSHPEETEERKFRTLPYRVAPIAFGIKKSQIPKSLSKFQEEEMGFEGIQRLTESINKRGQKLARDRNGNTVPSLYLNPAELLKKLEKPAENGVYPRGSYAWLEHETANVMKAAFDAYLDSDFAADIQNLENSGGGNLEIGRLCYNARKLLKEFSAKEFSPEIMRGAVADFRESICQKLESPPPGSERYNCRLQDLYQNLERLYVGTRFLFEREENANPGL